MGSNYTSGITLQLKRSPECQCLFYIAKVNFVRVIEKIILDLLAFRIDTKDVGLKSCNMFSGFLLQLNGLMLYSKL